MQFNWYQSNYSDPTAGECNLVICKASSEVRGVQDGDKPITEWNWKLIQKKYTRST